MCISAACIPYTPASPLEYHPADAENLFPAAREGLFRLLDIHHPTKSSFLAALNYLDTYCTCCDGGTLLNHVRTSRGGFYCRIYA